MGSPDQKNTIGGAPIVVKPPTNSPTNTRLDLCLEITGSFEGSGYGQVTGNFDGMGISCGILQWNYGQGSLQAKVLAPYIQAYGSIHPLIDPTATMSSVDALKYAKEHLLMGGEVKAEVKAILKSFLTSDNCVKIQKLAAMNLYDRSISLMKMYEFDSDRAAVWFFDTLTLNGSMKATVRMNPDRAKAKLELLNHPTQGLDSTSMIKNRAMWPGIIDQASDESVSLFRMALHRALQSRQEFIPVVATRRGTISLGKGFVYNSMREFNFEAKR